MKKIAAVILLSSLPFNSFASCAKKDEVTALDLRAIQSSMMVAALSCNQQKEYNKFMVKYNNEISSGGGNIKSYFKRVYGNKYESNLNRFMTKLANKATRFSMQSSSDSYCEESHIIFEELLNMKNNTISKFKEKDKYSSLHGIRSCG